MSGTRNSDFIEFEKRLPENLMKADYQAISLWSVTRLLVFNQLAPRQRIDVGSAAGTIGAPFTHVIKKAYSFFKATRSLLQFAALVAVRDGQVILRVNSFSILGEAEGRLLFTNKHLQAIYDHLKKNNVKCMVIISDLAEYRLRQKITTAVLYSPLIAPLVGRLFHVFNRSTVDQIVASFSDSIPLARRNLQAIVLHQLAVFLVWNLVYRLKKTSTVYYESPHHAFEAEVVAAKKNNARTIEIYHGAFSSREPSYFQKHLDFDGLVHSVCDEYLSQSRDQTRLAAAIGIYKKVTTIDYKATLSLSLRQKIKLSRVRHRPGDYRKKLVFITSITDNDVQDITRYISKNHRYLLRNFDRISLKLHPHDSRTRWDPLMNTHGFVEFSALPLGEEIVNSHALVVVSPTTILQLKAMKIDFIDLTRRVI